MALENELKRIVDAAVIYSKDNNYDENETYLYVQKRIENAFSILAKEFVMILFLVNKSFSNCFFNY